jgi:hypothetical protein
MVVCGSRCLGELPTDLYREVVGTNNRLLIRRTTPRRRPSGNWAIRRSLMRLTTLRMGPSAIFADSTWNSAVSETLTALVLMHL